MEIHSQDWSPAQPFDRSNFPLCNGKTGAAYRALVSQFVSTHKNQILTLKKPAGAILKIAGLEDIICKGKHDEVNGWGKFYLPDIVNMQVVGVVEGTSYPCDQLVLMMCEDKTLYAYDEEELHLVASSVEQLLFEGLEYPASKSYYKGEAFKDMTNEDWKIVRNGAVGKRLDKEHHQRVIAGKSRFLENLKISKQKRKARPAVAMGRSGLSQPTQICALPTQWSGCQSGV